jgi:predicted transcriptional regulator
MLLLSVLPQVSPDEGVFGVLERIESDNLDRLVVSRGGILLGFVSRENVFRFIQARR